MLLINGGDRMKIAVIVIAVLAIVGGGAYALTRDNNNDKGEATNKSTSSTEVKVESESSQSATTGEQSTSATITYSDSGFSPEKLTVPTGTKVTIKNDSSRSLQFDSDPHPAHTDNEELNVDNVDEGDSETFTVTRAGTFGYHNHLNPSDEGTIVVE
jgi:plastocyanin